MNSRHFATSSYDRVGDFYYDFLKESLRAPDFFFHENVNVMMRMLGDVDGLRVCDLACGEGFLARLLADRGARVTGIDLSANLLQHAQKQSRGMGIGYVRDDAQALAAVRDASFDAVACHMALMDIPDYEATTGAVRRVLKRDGHFVFCVLHPCFETPFDAGSPAHEVDDEGNLVAIRVTKYSEEGNWFSEGSGVRGTLGSIHRKLSTYLNGLIASGFVIREIVEPTLEGQPVAALEGQPEENFDRQLRHVAPRVLVVSSSKQ